MRINGLGEFYNFARQHGLGGVSGEAQQFLICMEEYTRMCSCDSVESKKAKATTCRGFYNNFARNANSYREFLLGKIPEKSISFGIDNQTIITVLR